MNLQQAELEKRSKELDAKEAFVNQKLQLLETAPVNLKVYEAQVKAKEQQLSEIQSAIKNAQIKYEAIDQVHKQNVRSYESQINDLIAILHDTKADVKGYKDQLIKKVAELADLDDEIKSRQQYALEQEQVIEQTASDGNEKLLDLNNDIGAAELNLTDIKSEITREQERLDDLTLMADDEETNYQQSVEAKTNKIADLQTQLTDVQAKVIEASQEYTKVANETDQKLATLKEKEESLLAKTDALKLEQQTLTQQRRQWQATRSLYD